MSVVFVKGHEALAGELLGLVQGDELEVPGRQGLVCEGALDGIQVVSSDGHECSLTGQVLVKLVLQPNEGLVSILGELNVAQDGARHVGPDSCGFGRDGDGLEDAVLGLYDSEVGRRGAAHEDVEVEGNALEAEHVISVGGDLNLELRRLLDTVDDGTLLVLGVFVKLDAEFEAEILELWLGESVEVRRLLAGGSVWRLVMVVDSIIYHI